MENKILFINACVRAGSRTEELSRHLLNEIGADVKKIMMDAREHISNLL